MSAVIDPRTAARDMRGCVPCQQKMAAAVKSSSVAIDPRLVLVLTRPRNWQRVQARVASGLTDSAWRVETTPFVPASQPDNGIAAWVAEHGVTPGAVISWEEHGQTFVRKTTAAYAQWCVDHRIAPLHIDLSNLDHGAAYIIDYYHPHDGHGLIDEDWASISDAPVDWTEYDPRLAKFVSAFQTRLAEARDAEALRPPGYVVLWTQWSTGLSRVRGSWQSIAKAIEAEIAPLKLVVKVGPIGCSGGDMTDLDVIKHDRSDALQNARLMLGAAYHIIVSSSVSHELVLAGLPVIALGRSRFSGKGVFANAEAWADVKTPPEVNQPARNRWLRWWAENTAYPDQLAERIALVRRRVVSPAVTTITAIYAPDDRSQQVTRECLNAVAREYPDEQRIAAVDQAPAEFVREIRSLGFEVVTVGGGKPPRLMPLYEAALSRAAADRILTVESDVILPERFAVDMARAARKAFADKRVACVEAVTVGEDGKPNYPSKDRIPKFLKAYKPGLKQDTRHPTFSGVLWRREAWRQVDWSKCAPFLYGDKDLWRQLDANWIAVIVMGLNVPHHGRVARTAQHAPKPTSKPAPIRAAIDDFARHYYRLGVWKRRTTWRGRIVQKTPGDLWMYQQIIYETKPDLILETGTLFGGSAQYLADLCDVFGRGRVITIDVRSVTKPEHPRVTYLRGSSVSDAVHDALAPQLAGRVMVILDSDHSQQHVAGELERFAPYVTPGCYLIVEDTNLNGHPVRPDFGPGPWEAVKAFVPKHPEFVVDRDREQFMYTWSPFGYLRRVEN